MPNETLATRVQEIKSLVSTIITESDKLDISVVHASPAKLDGTIFAKRIGDRSTAFRVSYATTENYATFVVKRGRDLNDVVSRTTFAPKVGVNGVLLNAEAVNAARDKVLSTVTELVEEEDNAIGP